MSDRTIYFLGFIFASILFFFVSKETYEDTTTKKNGKVVKVQVYDDPICGRSMNKMDVKYLNKIGSVHISKNKCINGHYKVGDIVEVIYYDQMEHFVMPYLPVNRRLFINFLALLVPLYCLYKLIKP